LRQGPLAAMDGADGVRTMTDQRSGRLQGTIARDVLLFQVAQGAFADRT